MRSSAAATGRLESLLVTTTLVTGQTWRVLQPIVRLAPVGLAVLQRVLADCVAYYMNTRTHLSLGKDAPASARRIVEIPQLNGPHHRYDHVAA